ncbi:type 2 periplasmic-binding domain-containing protein [Cohnella rhizosphaerae]|uniref:Extracellular solute-binding protein n=1 Tax=Cohnella rhizosphaerae TaxID=1457232 RepID=A0A9X4KY53_9BACL|nr:extracellular solute-binding protein [Cohnella rhizosphaerae]MDG0810489.1 extracellular solute-binding protein [Cohnella rhizosphaerae]
MRKKLASALLTMALSGTAVLTGCSGDKSETGGSSPSSGSQAVSQTAGQGTAAASDSSDKKVTISFIENGWVNTPTDDNDPWKKWMNETYNVDFKLSAYPESDLESKLMVQFASNDPPDMIYAWDLNTIKKLYKQGVLLEDWTPYLDKLPTLSGTFSNQSKAYVNEGGKMIGLPTLPES